MFSLLGIVSLFFALRTILKRKPIVFQTRWFFYFIILIMIPPLISPFMLGMSLKDMGPSLLFIPVFIFVIVIFYRRWMNGYVIMGLSEKEMRNALIYSLETLNFKFEETVSSLKILDTGEEFHVEIQNIGGTTQIRAKAKLQNSSLPGLIDGMKLYFSTHELRINYFTPIIMLFLSGLLFFQLIELLIR
jgi:hypothetical protein